MNKKFNTKKYTKDNIKLLAKEFPIDNAIDDNTLRNSKVDYLIANDAEKILYLVELKTTNSSFDDKQFENYIRIINENDDGVLKIENGSKRRDKEYSLLEFYKKLFEKNRDIKKAIERYFDREFSDINGTGKYVFQLAKLLEAENEFKLKELLAEKDNIDTKKSFGEKLKVKLENFISKYKGWEKELIYISLQAGLDNIIDSKFKKVFLEIEGEKITRDKINVITLDGEKDFSPVLKDFVSAITGHAKKAKV